MDRKKDDPPSDPGFVLHVERECYHSNICSKPVEVGMPRVQEVVEVWTSAAGEPERLVWRARHYRVTDMPTALVGPCDWWGPLSGHDVSPGRVPLSISGWRFQASADDGETHVFDVEHDGAHWQLVRVFD